ncbi:MAG TPA: C25 family cysteine peptidase, partial [Candidatus Limnocylindrales bacterium]|nr:C25 family cysteine peptidase [Candidatus Limnocylindrales bacterium]
AVDRAARLPDVASPRAAIATTDRIFAQFGGGRPDPVAIRNLLVHASRRWTKAPLYVCLLGDASEDPKNYTRIATPDWVPTYGEYWDASSRIQFVSDDFFAFLDGPGDQLFDLAIGRLPAHDPGDAMALVRGKRATFDRTADFDWWRTRVLLTADDSWKWSIPGTMRDPVGVEHVSQMERKDAFHIPFPIRREKVYLNDYAFADSTKTSKPKAREAFIAAVNAGNWMVDYIGHGNEDFLADEQVFRSSDLARLTNAARPSIWGFFSCTVGRFDENAREGLAELLLRDPAGGAAVSLAASREVFGVENARLNDSFMDELFPAAPRVDAPVTVGVAWARAKSDPANQNEVARKYVFLGEPAVTAPLPRGRGLWEKGALDSIPRGAIAVIRGHAVSASSDSVPDTLSTGTALLEVLGPSSPRIQIALSNGSPVATTYYLPGPVLYRGQTTLDRGSFELRFVIPTDGRVAGRGTQLRALLSAAGGEGAGLAADSLIIAAAMSPRVDQTPPTIRLRPASGADSSFAPGAVLTFEIEDSSGVDLTRFDNAHRVFVIVDDRGTPIDLAPSFQYEPSSYTRGTATFTLPQLSGGAHLLEVHASDAFRNVGVATFIIDVSKGAGPNDALTMTEVFNYPNPFPRQTYFHARLNRAARLRVQILTVSGRRVRDFSLEGKGGENYIPWDGRDSEGEKVAVGVYLVKLTAETSGGNRVTAVARALRTE